MCSSFAGVDSNNILAEVRVQNNPCISIEKCGEIHHHTKSPLTRQIQVIFGNIKNKNYVILGNDLKINKYMSL